MPGIQHRSRGHAAATAKRTRSGQRTEHQNTERGQRSHKRAAKNFLYRPDRRPGLKILRKLSDITEDTLYRGSGF